MTRPKGHETDLIGREELKEKLERGDDFKLVMVLGEWEYRAKRISGSLRVSTPEEGLEALDPDEEIVLYDSGPACPASRMACYQLPLAADARAPNLLQPVLQPG